MNTNDQQHDLFAKLKVVSFPPSVPVTMRPENLAAVKRQAHRNPYSWACWNQLGMALESVGDWPSAVHAYCRATDLHNDHADLFFRLGVVAEQSGELELAVVAFDDATKTDPDYCEAWLKFGELSARQGCWLDAVLAFETAAVLSPGDVVALFNLGVAHIATDNMTAASKISQQLADLDKVAAQGLWALMGKDTLMEAAA